jgi:hypothetical protein
VLSADPRGRLPGASPALPEVVHDVPAAREHGVMEALAEVGIDSRAGTACSPQASDFEITAPADCAQETVCSVESTSGSTASSSRTWSRA